MQLVNILFPPEMHWLFLLRSNDEQLKASWTHSPFGLVPVFVWLMCATDLFPDMVK